MTTLRAVAAALAARETTSAELVARGLIPDELGATEQLLNTARGDALAADARRAAGAARGPLDGIPFAVKANIDVAGVPTTSGTALSTAPAAADAATVGALRAAGMIVVRTSTMAELAIGSITDNPHTGACRNPLERTRNAGGSSGGSAALVAAGFVPAALGSDTMGSVRIPAAYCGLAAWKPARDTLPVDGLVPLHPHLDTVGAVAPTVADLQQLAAVLAPVTAAGPVATRLRIGVPTIADLADNTGRRVLDAALEALRAGGHAVHDVDLRIQPAVLRRRGLLVCEEHAYRTFAAAVEADDPGLSDRAKSYLRYGRDAGPDRLRAAHGELAAAAEQVLAVFAEADLLVLPVTPAGPPALHDEPAHAADLTAWANVAGLPAVAVPIVTGRDVRGVQVVGPPGGDAETLAAAALVETLLRGRESLVNR